MKTGMNLLLWTTEVTRGTRPDPRPDQGDRASTRSRSRSSKLADRAPYERLGKRLKDLGLGATAVTVMGPETNPISPDPAIRKAAVAYLEKVFDRASAFGCEILCGPTHSAIGVFSGDGPTEDEFKYGVDTLRQRRREGRGARHQDRRRIPQPVRELLPDHGRRGRPIRQGRQPSVAQDDVRQLPRAHRGEGPERRRSPRARPRRSTSTSRRTTGASPAPARSTGTALGRHQGSPASTATRRSKPSAGPCPALAAATQVWHNLFPDALGLCRGVRFHQEAPGMIEV